MILLFQTSAMLFKIKRTNGPKKTRTGPKTTNNKTSHCICSCNPNPSVLLPTPTRTRTRTPLSVTLASRLSTLSPNSGLFLSAAEYGHEWRSVVRGGLRHTLCARRRKTTSRTACTTNFALLTRSNSLFSTPIAKD
jgi:hypothetical protein